MEHLNAAVLYSYPAVDEKAVDDLLMKEIASNPHKIVVLDDDPTGVQTVHDLSVYTDWSKESIRQGFAETNKVFYILTGIHRGADRSSPSGDGEEYRRGCEGDRHSLYDHEPQ